MRKRNYALLLAAVLLAALLCGCGSVSGMSYAVTDSAESVSVERMESFTGYWAEEPAEEEVESAVSAATSGAAENADGTLNVAKLIYTAQLEMETLVFEDAVDALSKLTAECGGYFESSTISDRGSSRWAEYTIRVPAEQYRNFLDKAGETCHVLSINEYTEDVSESYYDTAGRLKTQQSKLERLQELLLEADSMEDIIQLESALSETEERIDALSGTLRHYDTLVDYSTVTIYLNEVKVYEPEPDPTYGTRLGTAFTDGWNGFVKGLGNILIALAYSWLWLLLAAAVVAVVLLLTRRKRAARRAERAALLERRKNVQNAPSAWSTPSETEEN